MYAYTKHCCTFVCLRVYVGFLRHYVVVYAFKAVTRCAISYAQTQNLGYFVGNSRRCFIYYVVCYVVCVCVHVVACNKHSVRYFTAKLSTQ